MSNFRIKNKVYNCPKCGERAEQKFITYYTAFLSNQGRTDLKSDQQYVEAPTKGEFTIATCQVCNNYHLIHEGMVIYPLTGGNYQPHTDMPSNVKELYIEANNVFKYSTRSSAALLRLALQLLLKEIGGEGKNINTDIKKLVDSGLNPMIQKGLDIIRITGNEAVHPGALNVDDKEEYVERLFPILNIIVQDRITNPNNIDKWYKDLPENKTKQVEDRDGR